MGDYIAEAASLQASKHYANDQLQSLTKRLQQTIAERDQAVQKFTDAETLWTTKADKQKAESKMLLEMSHELKNDNKQLMIEVDKYLKRIRQLENTQERNSKTISQVELQAHDLEKDKKHLQDTIED